MRRAGLLFLLVALAAPARAADVPTAQEIERVRKLARELEEMRGRTFKTEVGIERQSPEGFRQYVLRELEKDLPPGAAEARSKALQAFGLLPRGYDLRKGLVDLLVSQASAYYDPETKKFYLLLGNLPREELDGMILHELMHALQDQYYDLSAAIARVHAAGNDDAETAYQSLLEGEATYVMLRRALAAQGTPVEKLGAMADLIFATMRDVDRGVIIEQAKARAAALGAEGVEFQRAANAIEGVPNVLFWGLQAPYLKGQWGVYKTHAAKGWGAVDALFARPPASTEQVLHPEKAYGETRDEPVAVTLPDLQPALGAGWRLVRANTLGELGTTVFLDEFMPVSTTADVPTLGPRPPTASERAAAGWGGDRFAVYEGPGGKIALVWKTVWDTEDDAKEFAAALRSLRRPAQGEVEVDAKGAVVTLLDAPSGAAIAAVRKTMLTKEPR